MTVKRRSKYGAVKVTVDGITFSSKAESRRYLVLKSLQEMGLITELRLQPKFELAPSVKYKEAKRATPALRYFCDFSYRDQQGVLVYEDVKGSPKTTDVYRIKKHLVKALFNIEIIEVRMKP